MGMMQSEQLLRKLNDLGVKNPNKRADLILAGAAKALNPTRYVEMCLWRFRQSSHPSSQASQARARVQQLKAERADRRARQQYQRELLDQLTAEATAILGRWMVEIPAGIPQWEACLASLGEIGWAIPMAERLGVSRDVLFARKRRGMVKLLAVHPHLALAFRHHGRQLLDGGRLRLGGGREGAGGHIGPGP